MYARYEGEKSMRFTFRRFLVATDQPPRLVALRHHSSFPVFGAMPPASGQLYIYTVRSVLGGLNYRHESFRAAGSSSEPRPYETEYGAVPDAEHRRDHPSRPCIQRWPVRLANHWGTGFGD